MDFTSPQRFLLENRKPDLQDYMLAIRRRPGSLEYVVDKAAEAGMGSHDLKSLLGFAQKKNIIDLKTYQYHVKRLDLGRKRTERISGRIDPRDSALIDDDDDDRSVLCANCHEKVNPTRAKLWGPGWICNQCSGSPPQSVDSPTISGDETAVYDSERVHGRK